VGKTKEVKTDRVPQTLQTIKNRPAVAIVIVTATILLAILTFTTDVVKKGKELGEALGILHKRSVSDRRIAYDLAHNVAWISY